MAENQTCSCGCATMPTGGAEEAPCRCGCACCEAPQSHDQEIAELQRVLDSTQRRLTELGAR